MGGGILPIAKSEGKYYVLLSRETVDNKWKDAGKWSDFGGSREGNETHYATAIREGTEESAGLFGTKNDITNMINNHCIDKITIQYYSTYLVEIPYNTMLPYRFNKNYRFHLKKNPNLIYNSTNGLFEKDKLRWVCVNELPSFKKHIRVWYRPIIDKIYHKYK